MSSPSPSSPLKKAGIVAIIGRSNVGKSTLLNALVGTKVAITSPKPQTTRHAIHGIVHDPRGQAVFVDTPGLFAKVPDLLTQKLNDKARATLEGVDLVLYMVDPTRHVGEEEKIAKRLALAAKAPKIMVINKADRRDRPYRDEYVVWDTEFDTVLDISALTGVGLEALKDKIFEHLPVGEALYPEGQLTDVTNDFWMAELIREKVFLVMHQEIPYSVTVEIEENAKRDNGTLFVAANVITSADRYKRMLIGDGARRVKQLSQMVRKELELVTGGQVFVALRVAVDEKWNERFQ
jgi:GTP-binding protein Era